MAKEEQNTLQSNQILRLIEVLGEGPIAGVEQVYLNETALVDDEGNENFSGVDVVHRLGTPDQEPVPGFTNQESDEVFDTEVLKATPIVRTITNPDTDAARVVIKIPALYRYKSNGDMKPWSVAYKIEYRPSGGVWTDAEGSPFEWGNEKCTSPAYLAHRFPLTGSAPWEIRVTRTTEDNTDSQAQNRTFFYSLAEIIEQKISYRNTAYLAITANAQEFGGQVPARAAFVKGLICEVPTNFDPETRTYSGIWNGTWKWAWTDCPAWCLRNLLLNKRYGLGRYVKREYLDATTLYTISQYCAVRVDDGNGGTEPRFTFNAVIQDRQEAYDVVNAVASVFRGMVYWSLGMATFTQDAPKDPILTVTRANTVNGEFSYTGSALTAVHNRINVTYNNLENFGKRDVVTVEDPAHIIKHGPRPKDIVAFGCTSKGQAWRAGRWLLYTERMESDVLTYVGGQDHNDVVPGSIIRVSDPSRHGQEMGGRLAGYTGTTLTLDREVTLEAGETYEIVVHDRERKLHYRTVTSAPGAQTTLTVDTVLPVMTREPRETVWALRKLSAPDQLYRVLSSREVGQHQYEVTALFHADDKFGLIENGERIPSNPLPLLPTGPLPVPLNLVADEQTTEQSGTANQTAIIVSLTRDTDPRIRGVQLDYRRKGQNWTTVDLRMDTSFMLSSVVAEDKYQFRARSYDALGNYSRYTAVVNMVPTDRLEDENTLPNVTNVTIDAAFKAVVLRWTNPDRKDLKGVEIYASAGSDVNTATRIATVAATAYSHDGLPVNAQRFYWARCAYHGATEAYSNLTYLGEATTLAVGQGEIGGGAVGSDELAPTLSDYIDGAVATADQAVADAEQAAADAAAVQGNLDAAVAELQVDYDATSQAAADAQTARDQAQLARDAAALSEANAASAQALAETAKDGADSAKSAAELAQGAAETAATNADTAKSGAESARDQAETILTNTGAARDAAVVAKNAAETAEANAATAQALAETAQGASESAQGLAEQARDAAQAAETGAAASRSDAIEASVAAGSKATRNLIPVGTFDHAPTRGFAEYFSAGFAVDIPAVADPHPDGYTRVLRQAIRDVVAYPGVGETHYQFSPAGRRFRITGWVFNASDVRVQVGLNGSNAAGTSKWHGRQVASANSNQWVEFSEEFDGDSIADWVRFRPWLQIDGQQGTDYMEAYWVGLRCEDITESHTAGVAAAAAVTSEANAAASATEAGEEAIAANVERVAAETARSGAETAETNAATSASNALGSESAAASSSVVAAYAERRAEEGAVGTLIRDGSFEEGDLAHWQYLTSGVSMERYDHGATVPRADFSLRITRTVTGGATPSYVRQDAGENLQKLSGRTLRFRGTVFNYATGAAFVGVRRVNDDDTLFDYQVAQVRGAGANSNWLPFDVLIEVPDDGKRIQSIIVGADLINVGDVCNYTDLVVEDVTERAAAQTAASAAAISESNAAASATTAGEEAASATIAKNEAETARAGAESAETSAATSASNAAGSEAAAASSETVAAFASRETVERAGDNLLPISVLENGDIADYVPYINGSVSITETIPAGHPLGRTRAFKQTNRPGYIAMSQADGFKQGSLAGRIFKVSCWVYNASTAQARIGMHYKRADNTSSWPTGSNPAAEPNTNAWTYFEQDMEFGEGHDSVRWQGWIHINGQDGVDTFEAYWTDLRIEDVTEQRRAAQSANAAATSASTAEASNTAAGEAASAAQSAQTAAETAQSGAETAQTAASNSATDADGSASDANLSAVAAASSASAAGDSAGEASTSATNAATSASNAEGSASAASASQVVAANASKDAASAARGNLAGLSTVEEPNRDYSPYFSYGATVVDAPGAHPLGRTKAIKSTSRNEYVKVTQDTELHTGPIAGRTFRFRAWVYNAGDVLARIGLHVHRSVGDEKWLHAGLASAANVNDWVEVDITTTFSDTTVTKFGLWLQNEGYSANGSVLESYWTDLYLEDVTESFEAEQSANAAATSASAASASETAAGQEASAAQTERTLAETARAGAETAESNASTAASNAQGSESAASSSASVAASAQRRAQEAAVGDLVTDGDFEEGGIAWNEWTVGLDRARYDHTGSQPDTDFSMKLTALPALVIDGSYAWVRQAPKPELATLRGPRTLRVTGWSHLTGSGDAFFSLRRVNNDGSLKDYLTVKVGTGGTNWTWFDVPVVIPDDDAAVHSLLIGGLFEAAGDFMYFTQLSLEDVTESTNAEDFANAASTSASAASASATEAGQEAAAASLARDAAETAQSNAEAAESSAAQSASDALGSSASASSSETLAVRASWKAANAANGNLIWKSTYEDGYRGGWSTGNVVNVPAPHPAGRTKAVQRTGRDSYYHPDPQVTTGDTFFMESLAGRTFKFSGWVYNLSDVEARAGIHYSRAGGTSVWPTGQAAPANDGQWRFYEFTLSFPDGLDSVKWRPFFQINGVTGTSYMEAYWTDVLVEDVTAQVEAEQSASAAATSASNADASADEAGQQASAAQTARTAAETARSGAESAQTAATQAKEDAEGSASSAGTSATNAANAATAAGDSAGAAATSEANAASSATDAGVQASAASQDAVTAQAARADAVQLVGNRFFALGQEGWSSSYGWTIGDVDGAEQWRTTNVEEVSDPETGGRAYRFIQQSTIWENKRHEYDPTRTYRLKARVRGSGDTGTGTDKVHIGLVRYPAVNTQWFVSGQTLTGGVWEEFEFDFGENGVSLSAGCTQVRLVIVMNVGDGSTTRIVDVDEFGLEDITESAKAQVSAAAASISASNALASEDAAGQSAVAASTAKDQAETALSGAQSAESNAAQSATDALGSASLAAASEEVTAWTKLRVQNAERGRGTISPLHVAYSDNYLLTAYQDGTKVYRNGVYRLTIDAGQMVGSLWHDAGDVVTATGPIAVSSTKSLQMIPEAFSGELFYTFWSRYEPITMHVVPLVSGKYRYTETSSAETDVKGALDLEAWADMQAGVPFTIVVGEVGGTSQFMMETTGPAVVARISNGGDYDTVPPMWPEVLYNGNQAYRAYGGNTVANAPLMTGDAGQPVAVVGIGDGLGSDMEHHMPVSFCGDTYVIAESFIDDYWIAATEETVVRITDKDGTLLGEHTIGAESAPGAYQYGNRSGSTSTRLENGPFFVTGNKPFALRTNNGTDREYMVYGFQRAYLGTEARGSVYAAAESASAASASETAAGESASAALTSATNAGTSESNAGTSEGNAAASESNAAGSAAAALGYSEVTARAGAAALVREGGNLFPMSTFEDSSIDYNVWLAGGQTIANAPAGHPLGRTKAIRQTARHGYMPLSEDNAYRYDDIAGRTFRVSGYCYNASAVTAAAGITYYETDNTNNWPTVQTIPANSNQWVYYEGLITVPPTEDVKNWRGWLFINGTDGVTTMDAYWTDIRIEDVTESVAAEAAASAASISESNAAASEDVASQKASAASTSASNANTSAGNASTSAGQAATSAANALGSENNASSYERLASISRKAAATKNLVPEPNANDYATSGLPMTFWHQSVVMSHTTSVPGTVAAGTRTIHVKDGARVIPFYEGNFKGRVWRMSAWVWTGSATQNSYFNLRGENAAGNPIGIGAGTVPFAPGAGWAFFEADIEINVDTARLAPGFDLLNGTDVIVVVDVQCYDVTEEYYAAESAAAASISASAASSSQSAAGSSASAASSSASSASTSAGQALTYRNEAATSKSLAETAAVAAGSYQLTAARIAGQGVGCLEDAIFDTYGETGSMWIDFTNGPTTYNANDIFPTGQTLQFNRTDPSIQEGVRMQQDGGWKGPKNEEAYVVEVCFTYVGGVGIKGAGILLDWNHTSGESRAVVELEDMITGYLKAGVPTFASAILRRPASFPGGFTSHDLWFMSSYSGNGFQTSQRKHLKLHYLQVRAATPEELQNLDTAATVAQDTQTLATLDGKARASTGMTVTATSGGSTYASQIRQTSFANPDGTGGSLIYLRANNLIVDATMTTAKLAVGLGGNLLHNTDFWQDTRGWRFGGTGGAFAASENRVRTYGETYAGQSFPTMVMRQTNAATDGYVDMVSEMIITESGGGVLGVPIEAGQVYELSAYIVTLSCTVQLRIQWIDDVGNTISYSGPTNVGPRGGSSTEPDKWGRDVIRGTAPSNAVRAAAHIRKLPTSSGSQSHAFIHKPMLAQTVAGASEIMPFSPGGHTFMDGGNIITRSLSALAIAAKSIGAGEIKADELTADLMKAGTITANEIIADGITRQGVAGSSLVTNDSATWTTVAAFTLASMPKPSYVQGLISFDLTTTPAGIPGQNWNLRIVVQGSVRMLLNYTSAGFYTSAQRYHIRAFSHQGVSAGNVEVKFEINHFGGAGIQNCNLSAVAAMR